LSETDTFGHLELVWTKPEYSRLRINDLEVNCPGKIQPSLFPFIDMKNVITDVLHMELRVTDRFELLLRKDIESMDCSFSRNPVCNTNLKKYTDFLESLGIKKPTKIENKEVVLRDLNGKEKRKLAEKISLQILFPNLNRACEKDKMWKDFKTIMSSAKDKNIHQVDGIREKTLSWYFLYRSLTFQKEITPYIHIFSMHLHEQIAHLKSKGISLNRFSMQGLEKQNDCFTQYFHRATNKKNDYIAQILKKRCRVELLTFHPSIERLYNEKNSLSDQPEDMEIEDQL